MGLPNFSFLNFLGKFRIFLRSNSGLVANLFVNRCNFILRLFRPPFCANSHGKTRISRSDFRRRVLECISLSFFLLHVQSGKFSRRIGDEHTSSLETCPRKQTGRKAIGDLGFTRRQPDRREMQARARLHSF